MEEGYTRKEIVIAILASLLIVILCITMVLVGIRILTQRTITGIIVDATPGTSTTQQSTGQSTSDGSATPTPDILETMGATLVTSQAGSTAGATGGTSVSYKLETDIFSIVVFVIFIIAVIGGIILLDRYTRLQNEKKKHKK